ncbi:GW dipeptide domain-containing protein [Phaeodactylibacter xiamenensis]|jgi:hypothetical protein|uniref:GW dipeptide domain-containing protein n=1 Tax=Phaeodactylibacter xiamenensis TaxID=1524460 RepID=UPI000693E3F3|nr:GW dipeptide domain-containing protein [Phaeodactylibacter xiamenensis]
MISLNYRRLLSICLSGFLIGILAACGGQPKVIESEPSDTPEGTTSNTIPALQEATETPSNPAEATHQVIVNEVLNTDRYTYLNVEEEGEQYWVAVSKQEIIEGETYFFKGGLLKKQFFSQEFNRVFETLYLVSKFWKAPSDSEAVLDEAFAQMNAAAATDLEVRPEDIKPAAGAVSIADLIAQKEKYNNQKIKVTGKCVKVNPMIMNRNWVHLQDGSGEGLDLTITTTENIPLGAIITLEGTIAMNKDFGAGYQYDIIMEGAVLR